MSRTCTRAFFDDASKTLTYVVWDAVTLHAAIIDPVLDFDFRYGRIGTTSADAILGFLMAQGFRLEWILETHVHADHLSSAHYLRARAGGRIAIGAGVLRVQETFKRFYNLEHEFIADGKQFDHLLDDGEKFMIGDVEATAMHVPGHTPADTAYVIDGSAYVGDTLFMPDVGSARADFPGGDARRLYRSVQRLLALPNEHLICVCHDYPPPHRDVAWKSTVAKQRAENIHVRASVSEDDFVAMRTARDAGLEAPPLLLPSIQVNVRAGAMPPAEDNGVRYLRIPIDAQALERVKLR